MRKAYKYRLFPTAEQAQQLTTILDRCRELYNAGLEERREAYRMAGKSLSCTEQQAELPGLKQDRPEYKHLDAQVLQDVLKRLDRAFASFFRRVTAGQEPGYPRFKGRDRYDSFTYHQTGWKLEDGRLKLRSIDGRLKIKLHRPVQGAIKTVSVKRECSHWYVVFVSEVDAVPLPAVDSAVGIDLGLIDFLVTDTGEAVPAPKYFRRGEAILARRQRLRERKRRGGKNRRKAGLLVARAHRHVANQRRDFHHKTARTLVQAYGIICHEDLAVKNMVQNHCLAKSINDAGWSQFIAILTSKAVEAGRRVMYPRLKLLGLSLAGLPWPKGLLLRFQEPCPFDTMTSGDGPRGCMKNGTLPPTRRVYTPIQRESEPYVTTLSGFSPVIAFLRKQSGQGQPFPVKPTTPSQPRRCHTQTLPCVPLGSGGYVLWYHGSRHLVKPGIRLKPLKVWRFLPRLKLVGFHA